MTRDVFICYSTHDKPVAEAVCAILESRHIQCWIAPRDVLPGSEWAGSIVDAIDGCRVFVLVLSSDSNSSPQVIREVGRAASHDIPIVPLRIDDVPPSKAMEFFVSSHHWLDAQTPPLEKHLQRLADTIQQLLTQEVKKSTEVAEEKGMKCAYHPEREAVGACVDCGRLICAECKTVLGGKIYCNSCADKMAVARPTPPPQAKEKVTYDTAAARPIPPPQAEEKVTYNTALRWISGLFGLLWLISAIMWFSMFAESGLGGQFIVAILVILIAIACWLMAFIPQWVSAKSRMRLDRGLVFALALAALVILGWIITLLGPMPLG